MFFLGRSGGPAGDPSFPRGARTIPMFCCACALLFFLQIRLVVAIFFGDSCLPFELQVWGVVASAPLAARSISSVSFWPWCSHFFPIPQQPGPSYSCNFFLRRFARVPTSWSVRSFCLPQSSSVYSSADVI